MQGFDYEIIIIIIIIINVTYIAQGDILKYI